MTAFHLDAAFDLLLNKILLTFRAITANRFVPGDEFALWVTITPIEYSIFLGFPLDDLAFFAHRTRHVDVLDDRLRVATFREIAACIEFSESADFDDHRMAA